MSAVLKTVLKTVFCKVIAVLKNLLFFKEYEMFVFYDFLCLVPRFSLSGPINDKSLNLNQCTLYENVLVTTIKALEKITHSYKNKTKNHRLGITPLKETLPKKMTFFFLPPRLFGVTKYLYSFMHCNLIWLYIRLLLP